MPIFEYSGYTSSGAPARGTVEASGLRDAVARVKAEGILPSEVREGHPRAGMGALRRRQDFLSTMTRQLSLLLSTGVPLRDALHSLCDENAGPYHHTLLGIKERISGGAALHRALRESGANFPEFYINMVQAGEMSGTLDKVLMRLADYLESQAALRARVRTALTYPLFMVAISVIVLSFLFTFVIPKIVKIFHDTKSALPFITTVLIFVSNVFVSYWWVLLSVIILAAIISKKFISGHRMKIDALLLRLPGAVIQSLYFSRFARTLSFLLEGGLPVLQALRLAARSTGNRAVEASVARTEERVAEGQSLSASLEGFPPVFIQLVATGEKTGKLSATLSKAADSYEEEFSRKVQRAVSLFEPALILLMGLVVGLIVLAVLLPLFQLNQLIK